MTDPVLDRVVGIVSRVAGPARTPPAVGPDTPLWDGGFWLQSVELLEVMLACEEAFGAVFGDEAEGSVAESLRTVGTLSARVRARAGG